MSTTKKSKAVHGTGEYNIKARRTVNDLRVLVSPKGLKNLSAESINSLIRLVKRVNKPEVEERLLKFRNARKKQSASGSRTVAKRFHNTPGAYGSAQI